MNPQIATNAMKLPRGRIRNRKCEQTSPYSPPIAVKHVLVLLSFVFIYSTRIIQHSTVFAFTGVSCSRRNHELQSLSSRLFVASSKSSNMGKISVSTTSSIDDNVAQESPSQNTIEVQKMIPLNGNNDDNNNNNSKTHDKLSPRLQKAKLLLDQLTAEEEQEPSLNVGASRVITSADSNGNSNNESEPPPESKTDDNNDSTVVVPDTYWSNGLLDGSDVVTRYAFRQGVKIAEPLVKYDPIAAEKNLFQQPNRWLIRNIQIAGPLGWWAVGVVRDYFTGMSGDNNNEKDASQRLQQQEQNGKRRRKRAIQLRQAISNLGPAIIKAGQALASRPDLLPSEYLEELQKLQDDVPRFSNELAFKTVEEELGVENFFDVFDLEESEPIAAASIGQVYKGRLKANGDLVAIKIQRPNCEEIIALDLYVLRWWSGIYNKIFQLLNRDINVQSIIDDFGELIYREIDYVAEAANAQRFNELYASVSEQVFVPKVYSDLTTRKVLVMEWVDGYRLTDSASLERLNLDKSKLVDTLVQSSIRQILENGASEMNCSIVFDCLVAFFLVIGL